MRFGDDAGGAGYGSGTGEFGGGGFFIDNCNSDGFCGKGEIRTFIGIVTTLVILVMIWTQRSTTDETHR